MISKETIDKIFSAVRVEEIVGEYVQLKRAGANYKGLSPFHDEKSPSFIVSPSKQIWKDFSSGKGGTAISFLMEIENFTYPEALRHAAKKYGIAVEEDKRELTDEQKQAQSDRDLLYKIHEIANDFFQNQLFETEEGQSIAYSYFKQRELRDSIIKKFQLGYSPSQRNAFTEFALDKGYSREILEKSGLSVFPQNAPDGVDRFRERVLFPIHSFSGRVLGFGARILKNNVKTAKYLNSPETEIYHKSAVLYGLFQSKQAISKNDLCLLVEGYMDVIALHQCGIENVVASSGTALTTDQIKLIKRVTQNVTILFDGDSAGIKASFRSIDLLLAEEMNIRILLFPDGDDPDSFSRKHPQEYVEDFIKTNAQDFIEFKAGVLLQENAHDPIKRAEAIRDIVKSVASIPNPLKREIYQKELATKFGLSEQSLANELNVQKQMQAQNIGTFSKPESSAKPTLEVVPQNKYSVNPLLELEEKLVKHILNFGDRILEKVDDDKNKFSITVLEEIVGHFREDDYQMQSSINEKIITELEKGLENNEIIQSNFFLTLMDESIVSKVSSAIIGDQELSNWEKSNIFPPKPGDLLVAEIEDDLLIHKSHFIEKLIYDTVNRLDDAQKNNENEYYEMLKKIMILKTLSSEINKKLNRQLTKGHYFFKEQKL